MAISLNDLDALVGYDPTTHTHGALPTMRPANAPTSPNAIPEMEAPNIQYPAPSGLPSTFAPAPPSNIPKPQETGWQRLTHGLERAGNIAGNVLAPGVMLNIPGTQLHNEFEQKRQAGLAGEEARTGLEKEQAENLRQGWEPMTIQTPSGPMTVPMKFGGALGAAGMRTEIQEDIEKQKEAERQKELAQKLTSPEAKGKLAAQGLKLDENNNIVPMTREEMTPQQQQRMDLNQSLIALHDAQAEADRAKNDPNSPAFKLAQERLQFAYQNAQRMADALGLHQQEFQNKLKEQELVKPSGQTVSRADAAGAALQQLPALEQAIKENAADLGPIMGRLRRGQIAIGDVPPNIAKLYSTLESFYSQQPAIHGFRNAEFVKDFDTFIGSLQTNPEATIAGLEGLRPTLEAVEKSGRTYRQRIVAGAGAGGGGAAPTGGPPAGAKIISLDDFLNPKK